MKKLCPLVGLVLSGHLAGIYGHTWQQLRALFCMDNLSLVVEPTLPILQYVDISYASQLSQPELEFAKVNGCGVKDSQMCLDVYEKQG